VCLGIDTSVKLLQPLKTVCQGTAAASDACSRVCDCMFCRALLQSFIDSHERMPRVSEYAVNALRYVRKNAPSYYKHMFSLIVSSPVYRFVRS